MAGKLKRRDFLKGGALAAGTWLALPGMAGKLGTGEHTGADGEPRPYRNSWYPFTGHPDADTCWSLSTGPDGRIYAAACAESVQGGVVKVARYNEEKDTLDYLFALDEMVEDPSDSGRATQCKIHYSFAPSMADGVLYMAICRGRPLTSRLTRRGVRGTIPSAVFEGARCWHSTRARTRCCGGTR